MVTIATWNVNSIKIRVPQLIAWLRETPIDIVLLQELKCLNDAFPALEIEELGYNIALNGQKTYNGVAILSKFPLEDIVITLPGDPTDEQARYIEAVVSLPNQALRVASIYVPNGQSPDSEKFIYKMAFFDRLQSHFKTLLGYDEMLVLGGDYNVAPFPIDVYNPKAFDGTTCYHPKEREKIRSIMNMGLYDAFRTLHPDTHHYSWWDYRENGYAAGKGMRIDHILLSPQTLDKTQECKIMESLRRNEQPSDHAPVVVEMSL